MCVRALEREKITYVDVNEEMVFALKHSLLNTTVGSVKFTSTVQVNAKKL